MKENILKMVEDFKEINQIDFKISFAMPKGYEDAFGTYDIEVNTLFINLDKSFDEIRMIFTLLHELRHALQYLKPYLFTKELQESLKYVILYNGVCFKLVNHYFIDCKLENHDFVSLYLSLPYEIDANQFAYQKTKEIFGENEELDEIFKQNQPQKIADYQTLKKVFAEIDKMVDKRKE